MISSHVEVIGTFLLCYYSNLTLGHLLDQHLVLMLNYPKDDVHKHYSNQLYYLDSMLAHIYLSLIFTSVVTRVKYQNFYRRSTYDHTVVIPFEASLFVLYHFMLKCYLLLTSFVHSQEMIEPLSVHQSNIHHLDDYHV